MGSQEQPDAQPSGSHVLFARQQVQCAAQAANRNNVLALQVSQRSDRLASHFSHKLLIDKKEQQYQRRIVQFPVIRTIKHTSDIKYAVSGEQTYVYLPFINTCKYTCTYVCTHEREIGRKNWIVRTANWMRLRLDGLDG